LGFEEVALSIFRYQREYNPIYNTFCNYLGKGVDSVKRLSDIPFLPIEFFKKSKVLTGTSPSKIVFSSSGTTGQQTSKHYVTDTQVYATSFRKGFEHFYGHLI